jgi:hypothetical protein
MKRLHDLFSMEIESEDKDGNTVMVSPEFRVAVQSKTDKGVHVIIHANGHSSDTIDLVVTNDSIRNLNEEYSS